MSTLKKQSKNWECLFKGKKIILNTFLGLETKQRGSGLAYIKPNLDQKHSGKFTNPSLKLKIGGIATKVWFLKLIHLSHKIKWFNYLTTKGWTLLYCSHGPLVYFVVVALNIKKILYVVKSD